MMNILGEKHFVFNFSFQNIFIAKAGDLYQKWQSVTECDPSTLFLPELWPPRKAYVRPLPQTIPNQQIWARLALNIWFPNLNRQISSVSLTEKMCLFSR